MKTRVLFQTRNNFFERKGGDTVQVLKTKELIEKKFGDQFEVIIDNNPNRDLSDIDIVHVFNLLRPQETLQYVLNAKKQNTPIALSTIYWKSEKFEKRGQIGLRKHVAKVLSYNTLERLRLVYRYLFDNEKHLGTKTVIKKGFEEAQKIILENADVLLPNGKGEIDLLESVFSTVIDNYVVVPNAIEVADFEFDETSKREGVICVGRIEPRKNQLNLVRALKGTGIPVYLVGKVNETQTKYYKLIKKEADQNVHFIDEIDQKDLVKYYKKSKVHVLPSWYDTPGLVSLEAGYYGCNLVVGIDGTTEEYFGNYAEYVDPEDLLEIRNKVLKAYEIVNTEKLSNMIKENYIWDRTAEKTVEGYQKLLK